MTIRTMQILLTQWGQWASNNESSYGLTQYKSCSLILLERYKYDMNSSSTKRIYLSDEELLIIDRLIGLLKKFKEESYILIKAH